MNSEFLRLYVPGCGVANARLRPTGDFYDMEHPSGPESTKTVSRATHKRALDKFVKLSDVDPKEISNILQGMEKFPPLTLRQRLRQWDEAVHQGGPSDLARIVAFEGQDRPLYDSEKRHVAKARLLLKACLEALPASPARGTALALLEQPR